MLKLKHSAFLAAALASSTAFAQGAWTKLEDNVQVPAIGATVDQVEDLDVHNASGTKIGEVDDVLGTDASTPSALVVEFEQGGAYPKEEIVVPLDQFTWENNRLILNVDAAGVSAMEIWND